jgi:hypothetical protein
MSIKVTKADGSTEPFHSDKLQNSLRRAGATQEEIETIVRQTEEVLYEGITTQEIYRLAFEMLRQSDAPIRARYSLRRALFGLGPTGFPFEDFLARLFQKEGYTTTTRVILQGHCAEHELDIAAYKDDHSFVAEAKFHSSPGVKSDLQVVLYSFARLHDLRSAKICNADICGIKELMVVTNTKFTSTAEKYAECSGLTLLSWDYPKENNLHDRIQKAKIYPVSVLQSISTTQKRALIDRGVIVCNDIIEKPHLLRHAHISPKRMEQVIAEAESLTSGEVSVTSH